MFIREDRKTVNRAFNKVKGEPSDRPTAKRIFLGHDFQYLSVSLNSFFLLFFQMYLMKAIGEL